MRACLCDDVGHKVLRAVLCCAMMVCCGITLISPASAWGVAVTAEMETIETAAKAIAVGDFEEAREQVILLGTGSIDEPAALEVRSLLDTYDEITEELVAARQEAYRESYDKMEAALDRAHWRQALLDTSQDFTFDDPNRTDFEDEMSELCRDEWLMALARLTACDSMIERFELQRQIDSELKESIVSKALAIADEMEQEEEYTAAYSRVYAYLLSLDKTNDDYDDESKELLRKAVLDAMYVPDPNTDGITWQERREDVTFEILAAGLAVVAERYVDPAVDLHEMAMEGLTHCQLLAEVSALQETFPVLTETETTQEYRTALENIRTALEKIPTDQIGRAQLLKVLQLVMEANDDTLKLPDEVMIAEFGEGAFSVLDTYTHIVWPGDVADFRKEITKEFNGIGIVISKRNNVLTVDSLIEDCPAYFAGLDAGDSILAIDGKSTTNITLEMAVRRITGKAGTDVVLTIDREGFDKPRDFTITRQKIIVKTVKGLYRNALGEWEYFIDEQEEVAYIRLTDFAGETPGSLRRLLRELRDAGMKGLVLDLRGNGGGFYAGAVQVVDDFVSEGRIVSSRYRQMIEEPYDATPEGTFDSTLPLVVLVNSASASASEIVSGALQDHGRALIVGTRTYGKGSVQQTTRLGPLAEMKITIAHYHLPSGRKVHRDPKNRADKDYGVAPDVMVELTGKQIETYMKARREAGILHRDQVETEEGEPSWKLYTRQDVLDSDPQLQVALLCMQAVILAEELDEQWVQAKR